MSQDDILDAKSLSTTGNKQQQCIIPMATTTEPKMYNSKQKQNKQKKSDWRIEIKQ